MAAAAPSEASRPLLMLLITGAALLALVREWRHALAWAVLGTAALLVAVAFALYGGLFIGPAAVRFALCTASPFSDAGAWRALDKAHPRPPTFHYPPLPPFP